MVDGRAYIHVSINARMRGLCSGGWAGYIHGQHQCVNERVVEWWMRGLTSMVSINAIMRGLWSGG